MGRRRACPISCMGPPPARSPATRAFAGCPTTLLCLPRRLGVGLQPRPRPTGGMKVDCGERTESQGSWSRERRRQARGAAAQQRQAAPQEGKGEKARSWCSCNARS